MSGENAKYEPATIVPETHPLIKRSEAIKLLASYYGLSHALAQTKYSELKNTNHEELDTVLAKAKAGEKCERANCPMCGSELRQRSGKHGLFWGCMNYPTCRYTKGIETPVKNITPEQMQDSQEKLRQAMEYIKVMGSADIARYWLLLAAQSLGEKV